LNVDITLTLNNLELYPTIITRQQTSLSLPFLLLSKLVHMTATVQACCTVPISCPSLKWTH